MASLVCREVEIKTRTILTGGEVDINELLDDADMDFSDDELEALPEEGTSTLVAA